MHYVLGIDGGGTRTRAAIMNEEGIICGVGMGGASNYDDIGIDATRESIGKTVDLARKQAGLQARPFDAVFLGLGGVSSEMDRVIIRNIANDLNLAPKSNIVVDHDLRIALAGGLSGRNGIVQIAGTGSSTYGRNGEKKWRSGGWGPLIADEGSGYWFGIQAMKAVTRAADGRSQSTTLLASVLNHLEISSIDDILHRVYAIGISRTEIGALAPVVFEEAKAGDVVSQEIVQQGVLSMTECIIAVADQLGFKDHCELALTGGVFQAGDVIIKPLSQAVNEKLPHCRITLAELPPVVGACMLALEILDIMLSPKNIQALQQEASSL